MDALGDAVQLAQFVQPELAKVSVSEVAALRPET
jgi:hypothetical protein